MTILAILTVVVVILVGLVIKFLLDKIESNYEITWKEFAIGVAIICIPLVPGTVYVGWSMAKQNAITFNEYWNGWETKTVRNDIICQRDGSCGHSYSCDPYIVMVPYTCNCNSKGVCSTCVRPETIYHSCPYVDVETNYSVQTTLGDYVIDDHRFPDSPQSHRWRAGKTIPQDVIDSAGVGEPPLWTAAKTRTESARPGPVTKKATYENLILASDNTILKQYSQALEKYRKLNLLPPVVSDTYDFYYAAKVYFVGKVWVNQEEWERRINYFNAALGTDMRGDLHLVIVGDKRVLENPDEYMYAIKAHWQDKKVLRKDCLSKNGIVVIVGVTEENKILWARAFTGMPLGNEEMLVAIQSGLKGVDLKPEVVLGAVSGRLKIVYGQMVRTIHGDGILEKIIWGLENPSLKFQRVSMEAKDKHDVGTGFMYLMREIQIPNWQRWMIVGIAFALSLIVWAVFVLVGERQKRRNMW